MRYYQVTIARLRKLDETWRTTINRFRGPAPVGLAVAHMNAESNGQTEPTIRDAQRRPIGLMGIPRLVGLRFKYDEDYLKVPVNNIYVWSRKTNLDAHALHNKYGSTWTTPDYDFWLAVRLVFILGDTTLDNLIAAAKSSGDAYTRIAGVQTWVRTKMDKTKRFGRHGYRDLKQLMDHLDDVRNAMVRIDGPDKASYAFSEAPPLSPGAQHTILEATAY
jgi:hypothetical protein